MNKKIDEIISELPDKAFTGEPDYFIVSPKFKKLVEEWFPTPDKKAKKSGQIK